MKKNRPSMISLIIFLSALPFLFKAELLFSWLERPLYIKAGKIYTCVGDEILVNGGILIQEGKIIRIDKRAKPPREAQIHDYKNQVVIPGLIDAHSHAGFHQEDFNARTEPIPYNPFLPQRPGALPSSESAPVLKIEPRYQTIEALYYGDMAFKTILAEGITSAKIAIPSDGLVCGRSSCVKFSAPSPYEFVLKNPAGAEFSFSTEKNVMERYGDLKKMFLEAIEYRKQYQKFEKDLKDYSDKKAKNPAGDPAKNAATPEEEPKEPRKDDNREAILDILDRKVPVFIEASRINEIQAALKIKKEFAIDLILIGGEETYKIAGELSQQGVPVIAGPESVLKTKGQRIHPVKDLLARNVLVGFCSRSAGGSVYLPYQLTYAIQHGLTDMEALQMMTINAARIIGVSNRIGSIEAGKDADLVILTGSPFRLPTRVQGVFINGRLVHSEE